MSEKRPSKADLRTAVSAVLYGSVWDGFNGPTGVSQDEALDYAADLAKWVSGLLEDTPCVPDECGEHYDGKHYVIEGW